MDWAGHDCARHDRCAAFERDAGVGGAGGARDECGDEESGGDRGRDFEPSHNHRGAGDVEGRGETCHEWPASDDGGGTAWTENQLIRHRRVQPLG